MKPTKGLVAFVDILGYQNFIDNNSVEKAVEILNKVFFQLKEAIIEDYRLMWPNGQIPSDRRIADIAIQTLSDSIILHLPSLDPQVSHPDWMVFLQTVRLLHRRLFENGFPSRGAVASGDYYFRDGFLVGRPFMDAYRLGQRLEFAGVVLTADSFKQMSLAFGKRGIDWNVFAGGVNYLTPQKSGLEERHYCLSPLLVSEIESLGVNGVDQMVHRSFWKHEKDVSAAVDLKLSNTVKFLRYWILRNEHRITKSKAKR